MKVPAVAKKTFDQLSKNPEYMVIVQYVLEKLSKMASSIKRARYTHRIVDEFNQVTFNHPLVQQFSPCKMGCTACCHTQISVNQDEARLLAERIINGVEIDVDLLVKQAEAGDDAKEFYKLNYSERSCIFLDDQGACKVYEDRPSVCRTNAVLGDAKQCQTNDGNQQVRLVKTAESDMVIYASYLFSKESGALPLMVKKAIEERVTDTEAVEKSCNNGKALGFPDRT
jgi:Fe-S-cluster containining protein